MYGQNEVKRHDDCFTSLMEESAYTFVDRQGRPRHAQPTPPHHRRLLAWSRWDDTPRRRLIALTPDAEDYLLLSDDVPDESRPVRDLLWLILSVSPTTLSCQEMLEQWPPEAPRPAKLTLWRILSAAVERGELLRDSAGICSDPYRYWLPSLEERWKNDPASRVFQSVADARREIATRLVGPS
jgi:hypothetical protein